jgi:hypothetical protein
MTSQLPIGQILVRSRRIDEFQLKSALAYQRRWGGKLGEAIIKLGFLTEEVVLVEVGRQLGVPYLEIGDRYVPRSIVRLLPEKLIRRRHVFPVAVVTGQRRGPVVVATPEPQDLEMLDEVAFATGMAVKPVLASPADVARAIERHLGGDPVSSEAAVELPFGHSLN